MPRLTALSQAVSSPAPVKPWPGCQRLSPDLSNLPATPAAFTRAFPDSRIQSLAFDLEARPLGTFPRVKAACNAIGETARSIL